MLIQYHLRECIPLEEGEARDCLRGQCHPAVPQGCTRNGPCTIKQLLNKELKIEECSYRQAKETTKFVSTAHGIAYAVPRPTTTNIHCLQTDYQPEVMRTITLDNWGCIGTTPGCYIETENRRTHPLPYNITNKNFKYENVD